jgi:hypothetical protein
VLARLTSTPRPNIEISLLILYIWNYLEVYICD